MRGALCLALIMALLIAVTPARAQESAQRESLLITPTTQGVFDLPQTGVTLEVFYAAVTTPAHLHVTRAPSGAVTLAATGTYGDPLDRFEMPLIVHGVGESGDEARVVGWPGTLDETPRGAWLVIFDAHGIYARPAAHDAADNPALYLGPLEHFSFDLLDRIPADDGAVRTPDAIYTPALPVERAILAELRADGAITALPSAARSPRYRDRFIPEDLRNPGGFMLLGAVDARRLPEIARALAGRIPPDPDLPAPGVPRAPLPLLLPFDCAADWVITWGYHHSTPQNRFAVDFAALVPGGTTGQGVYAAHAGDVQIKRVGTAAHAVDTGITARVIASGGVTSTVYGHLTERDTLALWGLAPEDLPPFAWIDVGRADAGELIGVAGATGYATGAHIHFALWSWDQSLYQPVPLGPLTVFERGVEIPRGLRDNCALYR